MGETPALGTAPVPLSETLCGLPAASSLIVIEPLRAPVAVGRNVTLTVQLVPAASELPQLFDWAKSPDAAIEVMLNAALPVLLSVTLWALLLVPTFWVPKLSDVGLTLAAGAVPVPLNETLCGLPAASSVIVTEPMRVPVAVGVKLTLMVQLAPAAIDVPQLLLCEKSPPTTMEEMFSVALPVLLSVTLCAALAVPTF